jgi:glutamyl/glutaminyl-tRNA synthetase
VPALAADVCANSKRRHAARDSLQGAAGSTAFDDAVHGPIEFDGANIEDFVILRSDDYPTYHLSVVVDDVEMGSPM